MTPGRVEARALALLVALLVALFVVGACYKPWIVPNDKPIMLGPKEGLVAFAVDAQGFISMALCRDADLGQCVELGPASRDGSVVIARVPAGRHCVMQVAQEGSVLGNVFASDATSSRCIDVRQGVISYPGHFVLVRENYGNTAFFRWRSRWDNRSEVIRTMINRGYPHLENISMRHVKPIPFAIPDD